MNSPTRTSPEPPRAVLNCGRTAYARIRKSREFSFEPKPLSAMARYSPGRFPATIAEKPSTGCARQGERDSVDDAGPGFAGPGYDVRHPPPGLSAKV